MTPRVVELQSTFCPQDDSHHIEWESYLPPNPAGDPNTLITYLIRCKTCRNRGMMRVHAQKRWRVWNDPGGKVYKTEAEALAAAPPTQAAGDGSEGGADDR